MTLLPKTKVINHLTIPPVLASHIQNQMNKNGESPKRTKINSEPKINDIFSPTMNFEINPAK